MIKLTVIIVAYNSEDFIESCVRSLLKNLPISSEVIVIDNNSSDSTVEKLESFLPKINLIKSDKNIGFAKGNNLAAKSAKGDYLFLLNPDTETTHPIFDELIEFYQENNNTGIVAPKLIMPDGNIQPSVRKFPTVWGAIKEFILGVRYSYDPYIPKGNTPVVAEMVYGAAMLIKKEFFETLGGFDEKFFLYYEDSDLCMRATRAGKIVYYYPRVTIKHLVGATKSEFDRNKLNNESLIKYHGRVNAVLLRCLFLIPRIQRKLGIIFGLRRSG